MDSSSKVVDGGFFITKNLTICITTIFVVCIVSVGLMVHFLPPDPVNDAVIPEKTTSSATTENPSVSTEAPAIDVRIPGSLIPHHYVVYLRPFLTGNFSIEGYVEIHMECMNQTNEVAIHMADIITHNDTIKLTSLEGDIGISSHTYDNERQFYIATVAESLAPEMNYTIKINFTGLLNNQLRGFYRSLYNNEAGEETWVATTQFQPTDARRAFPCFDEPALKATFDISIGHQEHMTAISNMPLQLTTIMSEEGWYWDHFQRTVPMSTYLVAFVISDFDSLNSTENNNTLFRVWARPSAIEQAQYSLEVGPQMLTFFENYYNVPFPLPKQDMIALPDFAAGAMENWGLITYRETAMLYEEGVSSASNKQRVAVIVSHELAHQWFGDLVTPSWWTDLWLNEGFASYMEYLGVASVESEWQMMEQFVTIDLHAVFAIDCLESSHPISIPVGHPDEINEIFDSISYSKGASIIRMMAHFLSESTFKSGLTNYLNAMAYKAATQDDLWRFLTEQAEEDGSLIDGLTVKEVMDTWTLQMGYPVIDVERTEDGTTATVSQKRFLLVE